ncbi:bleomycin hydrolase [Taibaiella chishuiensis]|uniref:Aminopeptidase n=2 Tax=Taibaiella chishuiensis TaxID=1434707 RepID=A0A2P8D7V2_9BACT|nr:bleomycin hydrolase [Taibaiella chishuiensis]
MGLSMPMWAFAQDNLVKSLDKNASDSSKSKFKFTEVIGLANTSVKNQASSGTCWSYSTNSFLESEMIHAGRKPVELAQIFSARNVYADKADSYIRMHGSVSWGDGGACHDVINMYAKYGAMPQSLYTGLQYGTTKNKFAEMQEVLKAMLDAWVKNPNGKLSPNWKRAFNAVMDSYLGAVPETFTWEGKTYTPRSFADEVVGLNPADYIELSSFTDKAYYKKSILMVPDNWSMDKVYNVKMEDITNIIDNALNKGYTIAWATDVSEKYFSWKNGMAYVPEKDYDEMDEEEKKNIFDGPKPERVITPELRQAAFDNYTTTDDHGMHIVGLAKDQTGREYYIVKNSWGTTNDYKGYLYVTKNYVRYKTTAFLLNKKAIPQELRTKMKI